MVQRRQWWGSVAVVLVVASPLAGDPARAAGEATGSISVTLDGAGATDPGFTVDGCGPLGCGPITIDADPATETPDRRRFDRLVAGTYTGVVRPVAGWQATGFECSGAGSDRVGDVLRVHLAESGVVDCTLSVRRLVTVTVETDQIELPSEDVVLSGCGPLGCRDWYLDDDSDPTRPSSTSVEVPPGTYRIGVSTPNPLLGLIGLACTGTAGTVDLATASVTLDVDGSEDVACTFRWADRDPPNDHVADAAPVHELEDFSLAGATAQQGEPTARASVWYTFTAPYDGWFEIIACGQNGVGPPVGFRLYRGTGTGDLAEVAYNDLGSPPWCLPGPYLLAPITDGQRYYLAVEGLEPSSSQAQPFIQLVGTSPTMPCHYRCPPLPAVPAP